MASASKKRIISEMNDRLMGLQVAPDAVVWQKPAYWADLLNDRELKLWNDLSRDHDLDWVTVRQFFINFFADAIAYQRKLVAANDMYRQIHNRIHGNLAKLRSDLGGQRQAAYHYRSLTWQRYLVELHLG
jgi:hypothetical protein